MRRFLLALFALFFLFACKKKDGHLVVLTNKREIAPYIELFNKENPEKAVLIYQNRLDGSGEREGDVVIGEYLERRDMKKRYKSLDSLFDRGVLKEKDFYEPLLEAAREDRRLFMLPVSFNLPLIMFARENGAYIKEEYSLTLEELSEFATAYNKINEKGIIERLGFCPLSNEDFLYTAVKSADVDFTFSNGNLNFNEEKLSSAIHRLRKWSENASGSSEDERDFIYKYLTVNDAKQAQGGKVLAVFTTSDKYFSLNDDELSALDFRYLKGREKIHAEEACIMLAVSKKTRQKKAAEKFIAWFFNEKTQKELLLRHFNMKLDERDFGIAGGLSSLKKVNEEVMPSFYPELLQNELNENEFVIDIPNVKDWARVKYKVVLPFINEAIFTEMPSKLLSERYREYTKIHAE